MLPTAGEMTGQQGDGSTHLGQVVITGVEITPVAFKDPPLLNAVGVYEPFALGAVLQVSTDAGVVGLGETYGDEAHLARLHLAADAVIGCDVFVVNELRARVAATLTADTTRGSPRTPGARRSIPRGSSDRHARWWTPTVSRP